MTESTASETPQLCETCEGEAALPRTMYVHLCSGKIEAVDGVSEVHLSDTEVVFLRDGQAAVVIPRREVYYACCDPDTQPFPS